MNTELFKYVLMLFDNKILAYLDRLPESMSYMDQLKYWYISGHDDQITGIVAGLQLEDSHKKYLPFASSLIFELYQYERRYHSD